ncbi:MAG: hypothetical protein KF690_11130 [Bacteroidetes bacterium]|nr:hypothetical protein [Bacteroidota bacterium]
MLSISIRWCMILGLAGLWGQFPVLAQPVAEGCYADWQSYVPYPPAQWPVKRIRLVAHIIVPPDSSHIFPDTVDGRYKIMGLIQDASYKYRHLQPMRLPTASAYIPDGRVEFVLEYAHIFYHPRADWDWSVHNTHSKRVRAALRMYKELVLDDPRMVHRQDAIHLLFAERSQASVRRQFEGVASGIGSKDWVLMLDTWHEVSRGGWPSGLMAHELGHNLGLFHTTTKTGPLNDGCDDTPTYPVNTDCWHGDTCSNNIMDYNAHAGALTACQLGKVHQALSGHMATVHQAVIPDWCIHHPEHTIFIARDSSETWCGERRLWGDVVLLPGSTLRLQCPVHMPPGGRIIVSARARLILSGQGRVTHSCEGTHWQGVVLRKKGKHDSGRLEKEAAHNQLENCRQCEPVWTKKPKNEAF